MFYIKINKQKFLVSANLSILEACSFVGLILPHFCYLKNLSIAGNCRMCVVEVEKIQKPIVACATPISNNMSIFTNSPLVKKSRENVLEMLLLNHPLDCPICDQGGECDLQDQAKIFGGDYSRFFFNKKVVEDKTYGFFIKTIMTRCILCTRCVRFSEEVSNTFSFSTLNRGKNTKIGSYVLNFFDSEISGNVIDICPVGALTSKTYSFKSRPWDLRCFESTDIIDGWSHSVLINIKNNNIVRIQPKHDLNFQDSFISDKARFFFDSLLKNRVNNIYVKNKNNNFEEKNLKELKKIFSKDIFTKKVSVLINENINYKTLLLLKSLSKIYNLKVCNTNINTSQFFIFDTIKELNIKKIKFCFILSTNLKTEGVLLNTKLRLKYFKTLNNIFKAGIFNSTNYPTIYIGFTFCNFLKIFEGKLNYSKNLLKNKNNLLIVGLAFIKQQSNNGFYYVLNLYKKICPTSIILKNELHSNSNGLKFLGIKNFNSKTLYNTEVFVCINVEDTVCLRKYLKNSYFYWFNQFGSNLAQKAKIIIPTCIYLEENYSFLDNNFTFRSIQKVFKNNLEEPLIVLLHTCFKEGYKKFSVNKYSYFLKNNKTYLLKFFNINNLLPKRHFFFKKFLKNLIEDYYLNNTYTKNSLFLSRRSNELKKLFKNFNQLA